MATVAGTDTDTDSAASERRTLDPQRPASRWGALSPRRRRRAWLFARAARFTDTIAVTDVNGNRYLVRTDDQVIGRQLFVEGAFEPGKQANAVEALRQHDVVPRQVLDIGANIGTTMIELLRLLPEATAVAFEPEPENFQLLGFNADLNGLHGRCTLHNVALGDTDGSLDFELSADNRGDHRVRVATGRGDFGEQDRTVTRVPVRRLDSLVADGAVDLGPTTLAFVDIQGFEGHFLRGGTELRRHRVPMVMELWPYGLKRTGGHDAVFEALEAYDVLLDITGSQPVIVSIAELRTWSAQDLKHTAHRDLLAVFC